MRFFCLFAFNLNHFQLYLHRYVVDSCRHLFWWASQRKEGKSIMQIGSNLEWIYSSEQIRLASPNRRHECKSAWCPSTTKVYVDTWLGCASFILRPATILFMHNLFGREILICLKKFIRQTLGFPVALLVTVLTIYRILLWVVSFPIFCGFSLGALQMANEIF